MRGAKLTKTKLARKLRRDSTDAEQKLWNRLRSRALGGFKFVRQEPIGSYVVDFICREQKLVVEVDGGQHATDKRDIVRTSWLEARGYRVVRFWNNDVMANIDGSWRQSPLAWPPRHPLTRNGKAKALPFRPPPARGER